MAQNMIDMMYTWINSKYLHENTKKGRFPNIRTAYYDYQIQGPDINITNIKGQHFKITKYRGCMLSFLKYIEPLVMITRRRDRMLRLLPNIGTTC